MKPSTLTLNLKTLAVWTVRLVAVRVPPQGTTPSAPGHGQQRCSDARDADIVAHVEHVDVLGLEAEVAACGSGVRFHSIDGQCDAVLLALGARTDNPMAVGLEHRFLRPTR